MAYAETAPSNQPAQSLMDDSGRVNARLQNILGRITKLGAAIHGPVPRDASVAAGELRPDANLRRNTDDAHALIHQIESELDRIEQRL
jgi:hypothetical protein